MGLSSSSVVLQVVGDGSPLRLGAIQSHKVFIITLSACFTQSLTKSYKYKEWKERKSEAVPIHYVTDQFGFGDGDGHLLLVGEGEVNSLLPLQLCRRQGEERSSSFFWRHVRHLRS